MNAVVGQWLSAVTVAGQGGMLAGELGRQSASLNRFFYSAAAPNFDRGQGSSISSNQLILLNHLGSLPSVARYWDNRQIESQLRDIDAANVAELEVTRSPTPTAVQRLLAQRYGLALGSSRKAATTSLATVMPPPIRSLAILYGVLGYDGDVPSTAAVATQLIAQTDETLPNPHPLDVDVSPVGINQMNELFSRLGYIGRVPFSYSSAQLLATCLRTILADVDDEARLRPLPSCDSRQMELIRYLRTRRAPPGTRGLPAVLDVDLGARNGVSRLAAARNILQLVQNHERSASPHGATVDALRSLGHSGPVPPSTGEALMLATELQDRCLAPRPAQLAALRAAGYGSVGGGVSSGSAPKPESVAHVKALLRVLRRADTDAATPATRGAMRHLAELRRRPLAAPYAAAAAAAVASAPWGAAGGPGGNVFGGAGGAQRPGPCPSQLEVRTAIEDLPLSEHMMERLFELGWSGPMPKSHGSALALEDYLHQRKAAAANPTSPASLAANPPSTDVPSASSNSVSMAHGSGPYRRTAAQSGQYDPYARQQHLYSRLASSADEALTKIQIRGLFPGAVSEWYLPSMCRDEAEHLLGCLMAARRGVLEAAGGEGYDEYVERWEGAETEGDWWGMEWLWH